MMTVGGSSEEGMLYRKEFCSESKCSDMYKPSGSRQHVKSFFATSFRLGSARPGQARPFYLGTIRKDPVRAGSEGSMVAGLTWNVGKASDVSAFARVSLLR